MSKPSVLFISTSLPYPPKSGGTIKSWNYAKDLSSRYRLSIACLLKNDDKNQIEGFRQALKFEDLITEGLSVRRTALTLMKSYIGFPCLNIFRNYSSKFKSKIEAVYKKFDLIIVDHYEAFQYVPKTFKGKVVLHTHNAEFMLWKRMSELEKNPIKKQLLSKEAKRVAKYEKRIIERSDLIYATSSDIELYKKEGFKLEHFELTYHLGNDQLLSLPNLKFEDTELALTFMGTLNWEPNVDGLVWFITEVWPELKRNFPSIKLYVLGKSPDPRITKLCLGEKNILFTGFVEDLDSYLKRTRVYLAPLRFGSGMKVKVLEGLYRGVPTVSTSIGAEGIEVEDQKHIMIADKAEDFIQKCSILLREKSTWNELRDESRKLAAQQYRWKPLFDRMDKSLQTLI